MVRSRSFRTERDLTEAFWPWPWPALASALPSSPTRLAEREIETGRIVAPLAGRAKDVEYIGHYLVFPHASRQRRAVRMFTDWLLNELDLAPQP